jgi:hypothetical protein
LVGDKHVHSKGKFVHSCTQPTITDVEDTVTCRHNGSDGGFNDREIFFYFLELAKDSIGVQPRILDDIGRIRVQLTFGAETGPWRLRG